MPDLKQHLTSFGALAAEWEPSWLIDSIWQTNALNMLFGAPRARKTTLRRYLLACAFTQTPAFGLYKPGPAPKRALILLGEEILEAEGAYLHAAFRALGADGKEFADRIDILDAAAGVRFDSGAVEQLYELVEEAAYDFICIDPLINFHRQNENDAASMSFVLARTKPLWNRATLVVIHHEAKPTESTAERTTGYRARGSSAIPGFTAVNARLTRVEGTDFHRLVVEAKYAKVQPDLELHFKNGLWTLRKPEEEAKELKAQGLSGSEIARTLHKRKADVLKWTK